MKIQSINLYKPAINNLNSKVTSPLVFKGTSPDVFEKKEKTYTERIKAILDKTSSDYELKQNSLNILNYYLSLNDDRADSIKTIIKLIEERKLDPEIIVRGSMYSKINEDVHSDLKKLSETKYEKNALLEKFVPKFENEKDADKNTKTGDVIQIENKRNVFIKDKSGKLKELFITPETYFEFFTPVERFASVQSYTGDCYFLSSMNALYFNPNSRERILECFNEDKNGKIEVCLSGYENKDGRVLKKDRKRFSIQNLDEMFEHSKNFEYASGASWIQAFELLFRKEIEHNAENSIDIRYAKFLRYKEEMGDKPYIEKDGFRYYRDEIELYIKFAQEYFDNPNDKEKKLISFGDMPFPIIQEENGIEVLDDEEDDDELDKYANAVCKRYDDYCKRNDVDWVEVDLIMPMPLAREYAYYFDNDWNDDDPYMDGGVEENVFQKMNLKTEVLDIKNDDKVYDILSSDDFNKKYVLTASADKKTEIYEKNFDISNGHSYMVVPFKEKGELKFKIKNPSNFLYEDILSYKELKEGFDNLTIAEI